MNMQYLLVVMDIGVISISSFISTTVGSRRFSDNNHKQRQRPTEARNEVTPHKPDHTVLGEYRLFRLQTKEHETKKYKTYKRIICYVNIYLCHN